MTKFYVYFYHRASDYQYWATALNTDEDMIEREYQVFGDGNGGYVVDDDPMEIGNGYACHTEVTECGTYEEVLKVFSEIEAQISEWEKEDFEMTVRDMIDDFDELSEGNQQWLMDNGYYVPGQGIA